MKLSLNFGRGRSAGTGSGFDTKQFLFQHVEKILFAVACVFFLLLLFSGYRSRHVFDTARDPQHLTQHVSGAESYIDRPRWETVYKPNRDRELGLTRRAEEALTDVSITDYPTPMPWKPLVFPPQTKRADPELYPVRELVVKAGYGALAVRPDIEGPQGRLRPGAAEEPIKENVTRALPAEDEIQLHQTVESSAGVAKGCFFVCLTGVIPFQEQVDQYSACFRDAMGHDPVRDYPRYFTYKVERAEVTGSDEPPNWVDLGWPTLTDKALRESWAISPTEMADPKYVIQSDGFLNSGFQLPPILRQDLGQWALHPKIPRTTPDQFMGEQRAEMAEEQREPTEADPFDPAFRGDMREREGEPAEGDMAQAGSPMFRHRMHRGHPAEEGTRFYEGSEGRGGERDPLTELKLFRFFDFQVQPGKSYRYRVQLWLEDPNFPREERSNVSQSMLSNEAAARIRKRMAIPGLIRHYRAGQWSDPSDIISVPTGRQLLVGKVTPPGRFAIRGQNVRVAKPYEEPVARVVALQWDDERAANIPVQTEVRRGSLANFTLDAEYLMATESTLETLPEYPFRLDMVVLDIVGGEPLTSRNRSDELVSPGEMLLLDSSGNFIMCNELDDAEAFQRHTFEQPAKSFDETLPDTLEPEGEPGDGLQARPESEKI
jgi:hypothetical protein